MQAAGGACLSSPPPPPFPNTLPAPSLSKEGKWKRYNLPGAPRADVERDFGLRLGLIGAAALAELAAGRSQARHALHPQVIQVL